MYWEWLTFSLVFVFAIQFTFFRNLILVALWPFRLPIMAVAWLLLLLNYLLLKLVDPTFADFFMGNLQRGSSKDLILVRFFKGIFLSVPWRLKATRDLIPQSEYSFFDAIGKYKKNCLSASEELKNFSGVDREATVQESIDEYWKKKLEKNS